MIAASIFEPTVTLGTFLIAAMLLFFFGFGSFRKSDAERWRGLYELADTERKELSGELVAAREVLAEQSAQIAKLDALQMPVRVVEALKESTAASSERQTAILETFVQHEERAQNRHEKMLRVLDLIAERLGPDPNGSE